MVEEITATVRTALESIVARQQADYPFIDTKFSPVTGENFAESDPLRGSDVIYTWIQGRGLEALAEHLRWLATVPGSEELRAEIRHILRRVSDQMETLRRGEHLSFFMTTKGEPLALDEAGRPIPGGAARNASFADLFYAKGLAASAACLGDQRKLHAAETLFDDVITALRRGTFRSGQVAFDVKNPVGETPGRQSQGPWMIAIGGATTFRRCTGNPRYDGLGRELIAHVLTRHVQTGAGRFRPWDFWEHVDADGRPWVTDGRVWSDPGHATEFVGLALAHLKTVPEENDGALIAALRRVLLRNFRNGYTGRGLVKAFDLVSRRAINSDQPWWSLPETMRAAALSLEHAGGDDREELEEMLRVCWQAFRDNYLRPEHGGHAIQCLDEDGRISTAIPATPDLDPAYHTGLSLLAVLQAGAAFQTGKES